jgi:hypothetical protein
MQIELNLVAKLLKRIKVPKHKLKQTNNRIKGKSNQNRNAKTKEKGQTKTPSHQKSRKAYIRTSHPRWS